MSKALTAPRTDEAIRSLSSELQACVRKVFDRTFGPDAFVLGAIEHVSEAAEASDALWAAYEFTPDAGCAAFGLEHAVAIELGHRLLRAKARASEHDHHAIHAINHVMGQIAAEFAMSLASNLETAIDSADAPDRGDPVSFAHTLSLPLSEINRNHVLLIRVSAELVAAFSGVTCGENPQSAPAAASSLRNLDMLLDVELPVSISFGTTRMPLKDVFKLSSGSTIELNRPLSEPIQVLVNNCSIARGEVIVVDGKFAVRIKDIVSRQDRLRSLT